MLRFLHVCEVQDERRRYNWTCTGATKYEIRLALCFHALFSNPRRSTIDRWCIAVVRLAHDKERHVRVNSTGNGVFGRESTQQYNWFERVETDHRVR